eukprot:Protomagalhaensia_sp_Gyna_25__1995@NODE_2069_length_1309_cov_8_227559_g1711_i0_p1_GENE_NODE_2069_length_1309_cov_8_227559_g1711_i0NODE_2069_length_1309_cov_8_227559_g1711_i0_p1_ORF_typecomplete_len326_score59_57LRR_9/PF14580_6/1_4e03LRR_9/PF14580_6/3_2e03LRR_9/PF14580_6/1_9e07LRR_9/PF14580_6/0_011LRR_8/PF13855_6/2_2e03LRR_8/PF13855_6/0_68LRR_8/PF13855_6/1_7e05LRR_8/PF13855_6/0_04LRR_8/PF13855_6/36LRR_4/PF12799_7/1_1e04LRR_4/PF12799_7/1_5e02LRR_4/PF12799_7/6_8e05LRR_4/PF12799_7/0_011LRR_4/PF12799
MEDARQLWYLTIQKSKLLLEVSTKQRHLDSFEQLENLILGPFFVNRYRSDGQQCVISHPHIEPTNNHNKTQPPLTTTPSWTVILDLSRNFFTQFHVDAFSRLLFRRLKGLQEGLGERLGRDDDGVSALIWLKEALSTMPLQGPQTLADQIQTMCLTSNVLQSTPVFEALQYPSLQLILLNQNHITELEPDRSYSKWVPQLRYLDLKHNRLGSLATLRSFLGSGLRLQVLLVSCNFIQDSTSCLLDYLPREASETLISLGLFSNLITAKPNHDFTVFVQQLGEVFPKIKELSITGNPASVNKPAEDNMTLIKSTWPGIEKIDGLAV